MIINDVSQDFNPDLANDDLLNYLSESILSLTDEEIERESSQLSIIKNELNEEKLKMKSVKNELLKTEVEYQRVEVLKSVLTKVDTLMREGILIGDNRKKISELLLNINQKSLKHLKLIEEKLLIHVPENSNKVTFH